MMKHDFIKCGNTVVVKKDGHERLSRVKAVFGDTVIVEAIEYPFQYSTTTVNHIFETVPAPIDEKNIISDWIDEELLEDCTQHGNEYMGWFQEHPVYVKVLKNGKMVCKMVDGTHIQPLINAIQQLFDANPDNNIYIHFQTPEINISDTVKVSFHFVLSHN